jgi:DNA-binding CsgD family transcriptional regulator
MAFSGMSHQHFAPLMKCLAEPLSYSSVDDWRTAVLNNMTRLFGADAGSFVVVTGDAAPVSIYNRPTEYLEQYVNNQHLDKAMVLWDEMGRPDAFSTSTITRHRRAVYTNSAIYSEVFRGFNVEEGIATLLPLRPCADNDAMFREGDVPIAGNLNLYADRVGTGACSDEGLALLISLRPLLRSAAQSWIDLAFRRAEMTTMIDGMRDALSIYSRDGRQLHQNFTLTKLLADDGRRAEVEDAMRRLTLHFAKDEYRGATTFETSVHTGYQEYRLRATSAAALMPYYGAVLITIHPVTALLPAVGDLMDRLDLTEREAEVARLLCKGESNKSISAVLGIAESTARHHTQRVLSKLGVSSRSAVMHTLRGFPTFR